MTRSDSRPLEVPQLDGAHIVMSDMNAEGADEYVVIENLGTVAQPMTNWVLTSLRGDQFYTMPEGFVLRAGGRVRIHSGPGAQSSPPNDLLWTRDSIWNNKGDTAVLFGANGHEVARIGHGNRRDDSKREKLLYRENGEMRIEDLKPYKKVNLGWSSPDADPSPEEAE
ncbi:MAG: lamin tail domain-containing protein [Chloroflexota bacterium]|nr:lamin tail domain-containing protein [Chloroflexota bacterium]